MEQLLDTAQVAILLALKPKTVADLRARGGGPAWIHVGGRSVRYAQSDVLRYIEERRQQVKPARAA